MASHELVGSGCRDGEEELILNVFWKKSQPNSYFGCGKIREQEVSGIITDT